MSTNPPERAIDAVSMVRTIRDAHYELLKNASSEERIAFYRERADRLHSELGLSNQNPSHC